MGLPKEILDARWIKGGDRGTLIEYYDEEKRRRIIDPEMNPYFFIKEFDLGRARKYIRSRRGRVVKGSFIDIWGNRCVKIEMPTPDSVKRLRDKLEALGIRTYESDIPFVRRWMIDKYILQCSMNWRLYFDIEVEAVHGFPDPRDAYNRIISIACVGSDGKEYFFSDEDERKMMDEFFSLLKRRYHLMTGWNIHRFDLPYLERRCKRLKYDPGFVPIQDLDAMQNYKRFQAWGSLGVSLKLEHIAEKHLGMTKKELESKIGMELLWQSFKTDKKLLYEYNMRDARLVKMLDEKLKLCDMYVQIARIIPIFVRETPFMNQIIDTLVLLKAQQMEPRIVFPRKRSHQAKLYGGLVLTPKPGVFRNVLVLDFKSLFNRIIRAWKISPELIHLFLDYKLSREDFETWWKKKMLLSS